MKCLFFLAFVFFHVNAMSQAKLVKVTKDDPPNTARITIQKSLASGNYSLYARILETDSATIQLYLKGQAGGGPLTVHKGDSITVIFTDNTKVKLFAIKEGPTTFDRYIGYYMNGYYELSKELQQQFINKEVESFDMGFYLVYKVQKGNRNWIGNAIKLFD